MQLNGRRCTLPADSVAYQLVYSLPRDAYAQWNLLALLGIPLFVVGRGLWRRVEAADVWEWLRQLALPSALQFLGFGVVFMCFLLPTGQAFTLWVQLHHGHYTTVEGIVEDFVPGDPGDHRDETWVVADSGGRHVYSYSSATIAGGFDQTQAHGGPIHQGLRVRVADVGGRIARLEIAR